MKDRISDRVRVKYSGKMSATAISGLVGRMSEGGKRATFVCRRCTAELCHGVDTDDH